MGKNSRSNREETKQIRKKKKGKEKKGVLKSL